MYKEISPYNTTSVGLNGTALCCNNDINKTAYNCACKCQMVDFIGNLPESSIHVSLKNLGHANGKTPRHDLAMAQSFQSELSALDVLLEGDFYKTHTKALIASNIVTGLCYCSVKTKDGNGRNSYFVTKNPDILKLMSARYRLDLSSEQMQKYADRFYITQEELRDNVLNAVKVTVTDGKIKLTSAKVHINSKATTLIPMFVVSQFRYSIAHALSKGLFEIKTSGKVVVTSLNTSVISRCTRADASKITSNVFDRSDEGVIILFDFNSQQWVRLNVLDIISVNKK
jgi:hypothetical protein